MWDGSWKRKVDYFQTKFLGNTVVGCQTNLKNYNRLFLNFYVNFIHVTYDFSNEQTNVLCSCLGALQIIIWPIKQITFDLSKSHCEILHNIYRSPKLVALRISFKALSSEMLDHLLNQDNEWLNIEWNNEYRPAPAQQRRKSPDQRVEPGSRYSQPGPAVLRGVRVWVGSAKHSRVPLQGQQRERHQRYYTWQRERHSFILWRSVRNQTEPIISVY